MVKNLKYTPTPWACEEGLTPFYNDTNGYSCGGDGTGICEIYRVDEQGNSVWDAEGELELIDIFSVESAAFIVKAVNAHVALVEALEQSERQLVTLGGNPHSHDTSADQIQVAVLMVVRAALSLAKSSSLSRAETAFQSDRRVK